MLYQRKTQLWETKIQATNLRSKDQVGVFVEEEESMGNDLQQSLDTANNPRRIQTAIQSFTASYLAINPTLVFNENSETIGQQNLGDYPKGDSITIVKESNHDSFNYIKRVLFKSVLCPKGNWRATSSFGLTQPQQPYRKAQFQDGNAPNSKQVDSTSELDGQCRSKGRFSSCTYQQEISKIPTLHMGKEPFSIQNFAFRHNTKPLCVYKNIAFNDTMSEGTWNKDSVILRQ
ncbi:hypothetical protein BB559_005079 [Furculomyces boomerangus]|uniref:Uncharacterized protein n=1 Tax=Furculomyces boomerangus TaxID=61424 RepID=A0A2T9YB10_9FUNG|nr:hypothetical protein BB559_005079 [Furculomyces boomerangus]